MKHVKLSAAAALLALCAAAPAAAEPAAPPADPAARGHQQRDEFGSEAGLGLAVGADDHRRSPRT